MSVLDDETSTELIFAKILQDVFGIEDPDKGISREAKIVAAAILTLADVLVEIDVSLQLIADKGKVDLR